MEEQEYRSIAWAVIEDGKWVFIEPSPFAGLVSIAPYRIVIDRITKLEPSTS